MTDFRDTPIAYLESVNNCRYYIFILVSTSSYVVCNVEVCPKNALKVCRFVEWGYLSGENRRTRIDSDRITGPRCRLCEQRNSFSPDTRLFTQRPCAKFNQRFSPGHVAFESAREFLTQSHWLLPRRTMLCCCLNLSMAIRLPVTSLPHFLFLSFPSCNVQLG